MGIRQLVICNCNNPFIGCIPTFISHTSYAYVLFFLHSWAEFKKKEAAQKKANLGRSGPRGFQSRSMQSFQEALERGEADHLMPMVSLFVLLYRSVCGCDCLTIQYDVNTLSLMPKKN